jgi:hypothetical protein
VNESIVAMRENPVDVGKHRGGAEGNPSPAPPEARLRLIRQTCGLAGRS